MSKFTFDFTISQLILAFSALFRQKKKVIYYKSIPILYYFSRFSRPEYYNVKISLHFQVAVAVDTAVETPSALFFSM